MQIARTGTKRFVAPKYPLPREHAQALASGNARAIPFVPSAFDALSDTRDYKAAIMKDVTPKAAPPQDNNHQQCTG